MHESISLRFAALLLVTTQMISIVGCGDEAQLISNTNESGTDVLTNPALQDSIQTTENSCTTSDECGEKFCVKGLCQVWECEGDEDCAASGELARCNKDTFRCLVCEADDASCLGVECAKDSDCSDFDTCTEDRCSENNTCEFPPVDGCCTKDEQCDDGVECTLDRCKQGACSFVPQDNFCCATNDHCGDGNSCTEDICLNFQCIHVHNAASSECTCEVYLECDDGNPCTKDLCASGFCLNTALSQDELDTQTGNELQCCASGLDCSDGDDTTFETCSYNQCAKAEEAECSADEECPGGSTCLLSACVSGHCTLGLADDPGCCNDAEDCTKPEGCFAVSCENNLCVESTSTEPEILWEEQFDDSETGDLAALGWSLENDGSGAYWQVAEKLYATYPASLCFGVKGCTSYEVGKTTAGHVTSSTIALPETRIPRLSFEIATDVEPGVGGTNPSTQKDWVYVDVISSGVSTRVFDKKDMLPSTDTNLSWVPFNINLEAFKGSTIQIRIGFDTKDANDNNHQGVYVDDIKVTLDCPPS